MPLLSGRLRKTFQFFAISFYVDFLPLAML